MGVQGVIAVGCGEGSMKPVTSHGILKVLTECQMPGLDVIRHQGRGKTCWSEWLERWCETDSGHRLLEVGTMVCGLRNVKPSQVAAGFGMQAQRCYSYHRWI